MAIYGDDIPKEAMSNDIPMLDDVNKIPTSHAVYTVESALYSQMSTKANAADIGKIQTAAGIEYGAWPYPFTGTTNASGVVTIYLTSDGTSTGTIAAPNKVFNASAAPVGIGAANYNVTSITISSDRKTMTIIMNQIKSVLSLLSFNATADAGVTVQGTVWMR